VRSFGFALPLDRREFIRRSVFAAAAISLSDLDRFLLNTGPGSLVPSGVRTKVLVIGAGMSGLAAADDLITAGHDVTILEAQLHAGGRVRTLRAFADGLHAEAGAARIPRSHTLTNKYVDRFQLATAPFDPVAPTQYYLGGRAYRSDQKDLLAQLGLTAEEQRLGLDGIAAKYLAPLLKRVDDVTAGGFPGPDQVLLDRVNAVEMLLNAGVSRAAIAFFDAGFGQLGRISGLEAMIDIPSVFSPKLRISGGSDLLPSALARSIGDAILYGAHVVELRQDERGVTAVVQRAGNTAEYSADFAICTIPFAALRAKQVISTLSPAKKRVVQGLRYESVTRVYVQTRERFWLRDGLSGYANTDDPMEIWDATIGQEGRRGILMSYISGERAREVAAMPEEARVAYVLNAIGHVMPDVRRYYDGAATLVWAEDPWARGAYTTYEPGELQRYYPELQTPEGRIYFAGEHTSPWPGWIQGALHSGLRVAHQIHQRSAQNG
jgi:monoamine oxidase